MRQSPPPRHSHAVLPKLTEHRVRLLVAMRDLDEKLGRQPSYRELSEALGISQKSIENMLRAMPPFVCGTRITPLGIAAIAREPGRKTEAA